MGVIAREAQALRETLRGWAGVARWLWARRPPRTRIAAIAFAAGALGAGLLSIVAQAGLPARLPTSRDWAALRALVEREGRPGDAVALAPPWAERAREVLPASIPVLALPRYAGEDLVGVRRVWLVSLPDAPGFSWEPEVDLAQRSGRSDPPVRVGALEVTRYEVAFPVLPLAFLPDRLAQAEVSRGGVACAADAPGAFRCGEGRVSREVREVGGAPRPCVVAAIGGGVPLEVQFPSVRIGRTVRGHAGALRNGALPGPVRVSVFVDGDEAGAVEITGAGFVPFQVDTTRHTGHARPVSLVLTTPGAEAELCLDAVTLP